MTAPALTIGIDARAAVEERGGRGTLVRELLRALAAEQRAGTGSGHRYVCFARERWQDPEVGDALSWILNPSPDPRWHLAAARTASRRTDVFLSTNSYLTAWFLRVPSVVVVCDMVSYHPEYLPQKRAGRIERLTLPLAVRRAGALAAISASAADDLMTHFPSAAGRTAVTPLAASPRFSAAGADADEVRARHNLRRPYLLGVGTLEPRKNLPRLIEAFAALDPAVRGDHELLLVGRMGWDEAQTVQALGAHPGLVRTLGAVDDGDLPALYRGATAFAYPSLYEGFGLPVLEAMTAGVPVLTSNVSSLPEVGGDAAVYADPRDVASICDGLGRLLIDPALRDHLVVEGKARAATFSWSRYARQTVELCEQVAPTTLTA